MSNRLIAALLFAAGLLVIAVFYWQTRPVEDVSDTARTVMPAANGVTRPVLDIEVSGQANGTIRVELFSDIAPGHADRMVTLARDGAYDGIVFHRVIDGFMAQTGDVQFGKGDSDTSRAGMGGSDMPDLKAEFSDVPFERGIVGMARSANPNSANSQFFIMFAPAPHLNNQYTVVGQVISGLDVLDAIKRGTGPNGAVLGVPDRMAKVTVEE